MSNRELLELAAKAAGLKIDKSPYNGGGAGNTGFDVLGNAVLDWHSNKRWNPITDDGDALRLAVKLKLVVDCGPVSRCVHISNGQRDAGFEWHGFKTSDKEAATRRAIVRCAAAIAGAKGCAE